MPRLTNLVGQTFNRLTVISRAENKGKKVCWYCNCSCGIEMKVIESYHLTSGSVQSCGCLQIENRFKYPKIYYNGVYIPATSHPLFSTYHNIKNRCYNPKVDNYKRYGGRGITMSGDWRQSFMKFVMDMGEKPSKNHSIERRNNLEGYYKSNCYWATSVEQSNNQRSNIQLTYNRETLNISEWSNKLKIDYHALYARVKRGWSVERIFTQPYRERNASIKTI